MTIKIKLMFAVVSMLMTCTTIHAGTLFFSSQANQENEIEAVTNTVLSNYDDEVNFVAVKGDVWASRMTAEGRATRATKDSVGLTMALHGEYSGLLDNFWPVDDVLKSDSLKKLRKDAPKLLDLARMDGKDHKYVPVMQATYIFAVNKKAFDYLPKGLSKRKVLKGKYTYDDLLAWAKRIKAETGQNKIGFPAGQKGLLHRFFQGYLYPSFTGGVVSTFRSNEAIDMWNYFEQLWTYVDERSESETHMQNLLVLDDGPWIAFDHTSRLKDAFDAKPEEILAIPAPTGDMGRGYMTVLVGVSIPKNAPNRRDSTKLIEFLSQADTQIDMLRATGFFPVVDVDLPKDMPNSSKASVKAIARQARGRQALPALLPTGLGGKSGDFSKIYVNTFKQIVLGGADPKQTLDKQAKVLSKLMRDTNAPCWAPDKPSNGACPVR